MNFFKNIVLTAFILTVFAVPSFSQETETKVVDEVVAQVNEGVITLSRVKREAKDIVDAKVQGGMKREEAQKQVDEKQGELIANLINEELIVQKAKELGIEKDIDEAINQRYVEIMKQQNIKTIPELAVLLRFGNEGEHWQRNPETNAVIPTADYVNPANRGPLGTNFFAALPPSPEIQASIARSDEADLYAQAIAGNVKNFIPFATLLVPSEVTSQATEMDPVREKWLANFISGNESLDNWNGFLDEWNDAGGAAMTEATNATFPELQSVRADIATAVGAPATPAVEATPAS